MELELTNAERLILIHQCRIMEALYPDEADDIEVWREALENGYTIHYGDRANLSEEMSFDECREVLDILKMYQDIYYGFREMSPADKQGIDEYRIRFHGFDGNEEGRQYSYADYFINRLERYAEFKESPDKRLDVNSHGPRLDAYRRMLKVWRQHEHRPMTPLTKDEILAIVAAQKHPESR